MHVNWLTFTGYPYHLADKVVFITSGTTYVPTYGARALVVECVGGGGGGGGAATASVSAAAGGGGAAGGYAYKWITAPLKSSYTYAIGGGGSAGANTGGNGGNGAATTFDSPSVVQALGGGGGTGMAAGTTQLFAAGGTAEVGSQQGDFAGDVNNGGWALRLSGTVAASGYGNGQAPFSAQNQGRVAVGNGNGGLNYGGGGGGALVLNGSTAATGGPGAPGCIRIWELF